MGMHAFARRDGEELSGVESGMYEWLLRRSDDAYHVDSDFAYWWTVYCDLMEFAGRRGPKMCCCGHAWRSHTWEGGKFPCAKCPSVGCTTFTPSVRAGMRSARRTTRTTGSTPGGAS